LFHHGPEPIGADDEGAPARRRTAHHLADAGDLDYSATCAHGRPTAIKLTFDDLERLFRRK